VGKKQNRPPHKPGAEAETQGVLPRPPERISSPFKDALSGMKKEMEAQAKKAAEDAKAKLKAPPPVVMPTKREKFRASDDAMALSLAMHGVRPLEDKRVGRVSGTTPKVQSRTAQVAPFGISAEDQARARLDALVAQDVRFRIEGDRDHVSGVRIDADFRIARELRRRTRYSEKLDLHGMNQRESRDSVTSFVRRCHKQGLDVICIVHGKGQHSEDGMGVLRDVAVRALTDTAAATLVRAFVTAPDALGGRGALLVELKH
jgi:DNA-nicking Smr family endonuclease